MYSTTRTEDHPMRLDITLSDRRGTHRNYSRTVYVADETCAQYVLMIVTPSGFNASGEVAF